MWPEIQAGRQQKTVAAAATPASRSSGTGRDDDAGRASPPDRHHLLHNGHIEPCLPVDDVRPAQGFCRAPGGIAGSATLIGWLAFVVFAVASVAQIVVGKLLDTLGPRPVFMGVATLQLVFFALMPGLSDWAALAVALGFMLGAFGQIPINDYMIGRMAKSELRASIYGVRYVISFLVLGAALP